MKPTTPTINRRSFLAGSAAGVGLAVTGLPASAKAAPILRTIPSSGERVPVMGLGTYLTFNVGRSTSIRQKRVDVMQAFIDGGGGMVDSSPMYGASEEVIGYCLGKVTNREKVFTATKVWTPFDGRGVTQMDASEELWGEKQFDLFQVHNLLNWETHLETLKQRKAAGRIRYIGVTTSHGRYHSRFEDVMKSKPLDFVQLTYNVLDREVESRLLPLAADKGIAVIVNRPFQREGLFSHVGNAPLPGFAAEIGAKNWAQLFLKFVISHPAVTVAIPATRQVEHLRENIEAATGPLPDQKMRNRIIDAVERI